MSDPTEAPEQQDPGESTLRSLSRKRSIHELEAISELDQTPTKRRRGDPDQYGMTDEEQVDAEDSATALNGEHINGELNGDSASPLGTPQVTPTPKRRGRPPKIPRPDETPSGRKSRQPNPETPIKAVKSAFSTPRRQAADRSARKKSARALIETIARNVSDDDEDDYDGLAREIYESSDEHDYGVEDEDEEEGETPARADNNLRTDGLTRDEAGAEGDEPVTPSKPLKRKGRPKRVRSPTPPRDLPPHELYFLQNKPGRPKTSDNTLSSLALLSHEEYFSALRTAPDHHEADVAFLESLHAESFPQWAFELAQGFSLCLYGYGSKRGVLRRLAGYVHKHAVADRERHRIVIVNGYAEATTIREVLGVVATAVFALGDNSKDDDGDVPSVTTAAPRVSNAQPTVVAQQITAHLASVPGASLTLVVNSVDAPPLRKPAAQAALAHLAASPRVRLACSADTPDFPLLWDVGLRSALNFAFHDCTTFAPLAAVEVDAVDVVHELLGRAARRVNGREGVAFVLKSLPENARNLFRLLVGEVLVAMEEGGGAGEESEGVEYRMLYNKAVEEFICSSEVAFRTLLKEFHDHQMITSYKDALGTELLSVPFQKEELEAILEDLMG